MTPQRGTGYLSGICLTRRSESLNEHILQILSRALTHLIFRNGEVELLHEKGACLDDETMAKLNRDINDRFYTVLTIWFNGTEDEQMRLERTLNFLAKYYGNRWDRAKYLDSLIN